MSIFNTHKVIYAIVLAGAIIPAFFLSPMIRKLAAATCTWSGGNGTWETAANWSNCGGGVPGAADDAVINSNVTVSINASTTVNSLTLGNSGGTTTPTLNFNYDSITNGALIIDDGDLTVYSGAIVTHTDANNATIVGTMNINVATGNASISGSINVNHLRTTRISMSIPVAVIMKKISWISR